VEADLHGRIVLITGATSGIGKEAARQLSAQGATVVVAARDPTRGEQVKEEIAWAEGPEGRESVKVAEREAGHRVAEHAGEMTGVWRDQAARHQAGDRCWWPARRRVDASDG
jgi:NAD(P)-dependent dehydrogenase (short-subunit alcohol dehydrogenase family)